ncbi:hypothetical protein CVT24_009051 [Panaeolus cyanescens]|uniref:Uncharacterized protein n=1 Tax=Panaeolus cyanescens TaxID=181874 RepID=A0A409WTX9_9AGAR|nr:hypothetical protein CVT24_009051 [Panaeolus cyanescens]
MLMLQAAFLTLCQLMLVLRTGAAVVTLYNVDIAPTPTPTQDLGLMIYGTTKYSAINPGQTPDVTRYAVEEVRTQAVFIDPTATVTIISVPTTLSYTIEQGALIHRGSIPSNLHFTAPNNGPEVNLAGYSQDCTFDTDKKEGVCELVQQRLLPFTFTADNGGLTTTTSTRADTLTYSGTLKPVATITTGSASARLRDFSAIFLAFMVAQASCAAVTLYYVEAPGPTPAPSNWVEPLKVEGTTIYSALNPGASDLTKYEVKEIHTRVVYQLDSETITLASKPSTKTFTIEQGVSVHRGTYVGDKSWNTVLPNGVPLQFGDSSLDCKFDAEKNEGVCALEAIQVNPSRTFTIGTTYTGSLLPLATVSTTSSGIKMWNVNGVLLAATGILTVLLAWRIDTCFSCHFAGLGRPSCAAVTLYQVSATMFMDNPLKLEGTAIYSAIGPSQSDVTKYQVQDIYTRVAFEDASTTYTITSQPFTRTYTIEQGATVHRGTLPAYPQLDTVLPNGVRIGFPELRLDCKLDADKKEGVCAQDAVVAAPTSTFTVQGTYTGPLIPLATISSSAQSFKFAGFKHLLLTALSPVLLFVAF